MGKIIEKIKKKYIGMWVALKGSKVLAFSKDYHELHQTLKKKHVKGSIEVKYFPNPKEKKYEILL